MKILVSLIYLKRMNTVVVKILLKLLNNRISVSLRMESEEASLKIMKIQLKSHLN